MVTFTYTQTRTHNQTQNNLKYNKNVLFAHLNEKAISVHPLDDSFVISVTNTKAFNKKRDLLFLFFLVCFFVWRQGLTM